MKVKTKKVILAIFFCAGILSKASASELYFGGSIIAHNAGKTATKASTGDKPLFGELYHQLAATAFFPLYKSYRFSPDFHYSVTSKKSPEGGESTKIYSLGFRVVSPTMVHLFDWHLGPGLLFYQISGAGGTVTLSNGSGTTVFGIPNSSATTRLMYWDAGLGLNIGRVRAETAVLVTGLLSSRRAYNPMLTLSWRLF